ncbi:MAG: thiamine phosphate synthase [Thiobacillaceae bacterium]|nr:thiamine phosphate synthase [Thiobacillaceae bacterium]MDW8324089.1 thiamine phosphate synthase [Burkholderiales bacterium]
MRPETVAPSGLYALTPDWDDTARLLAATEPILQAGCRWLQYRHKTAPAALRLAQARALRALTRRYGAHLIINDDVRLALAVGADGAHLGRDDGDLAAARMALGPSRVLGASCYQNLQLAHRAVAAGADYVAFGSVFPSTTKPQAAHAPLALIGQARRELPVAVVAIGGITLDNAAAVLAAGAHALAVIGAVYTARDPGAAAAGLLALCGHGAAAADRMTPSSTNAPLSPVQP